jgi:hypothetical protein
MALAFLGGEIVHCFFKSSARFWLVLLGIFFETGPEGPELED